MEELLETQRELELGRSQASSAALIEDERYEFIEEIARGGAAVVWRVRDHHLQRETAVKYLLDSRDNADMRARLEREARLCAGLVHPGIVPIHELSSFADQRPFVSMKLIEGKTWLQHLQSEPRPTLQNGIEIFSKVCEAMAYAHGKEIIHRDLKPSNIMVGKFGEVQIMDWGLAKDLSEQSNSHHSRSESQVVGSDTVTVREPSIEDTATCVQQQETTLIGTVFGTLAYMSPEQANGLVDMTDKRSDVFSLGAVLCRLLTGHPPYDAESQDELLLQAQSANQSLARKRLSQSAHRGLAFLAARCLESDPRQRPADAAAVLQQVLSIQRADASRRQWRNTGLLAIGLATMVCGIVLALRSGEHLGIQAASTGQAVTGQADNGQGTIELDVLMELLRTGRIDVALPHCFQALAKHPNDWELHYQVCVALLNRERFAEAQRVAAHLVTLPPDRVEPHFMLSTALFWQGKFDEALVEVLHSQRLRDAGEAVIPPISTRIDEAVVRIQRFASHAKQIAAWDRSKIDAYTPLELLDVGKACLLSGRLGLAVELFRSGLVRIPDAEQRRISKFQLMVYVGRRHILDDILAQSVRDQASRLWVEWFVDLANAATDANHTDARLLQALKVDSAHPFIVNLSKDERVDASVRAQLNQTLAIVTAAIVPSTDNDPSDNDPSDIDPSDIDPSDKKIK